MVKPAVDPWSSSAAMPSLLVWLWSLRLGADKWTCSQSIALVLGGEAQPAPYWRALVVGRRQNEVVVHQYASADVLLASRVPERRNVWKPCRTVWTPCRSPRLLKLPNGRPGIGVQSLHAARHRCCPQGLLLAPSPAPTLRGVSCPRRPPLVPLEQCWPSRQIPV